MASSNSLPKIPGTTPFDGVQAQKGYALNKMCFSFNSAEKKPRAQAKLKKAVEDRAAELGVSTVMEFTQL